MGAGMSWLSNLIWAKKDIRILILGLVRRPRGGGGGSGWVTHAYAAQDNAGKTTLLYRLKVRGR